MKTMLTKTQQREWLDKHHELRTLQHKWSYRGYGNSKILDANGDTIAKARGCGYDRYGAALGRAVTAMFGDAVHKLAKRVCKDGERPDYKGSKVFYGLFYDKTKDSAWIDGACGSSQVIRILNKIGFSLIFVGETNTTPSTVAGSQFYRLEPLSVNDRRRYS